MRALSALSTTAEKSPSAAARARGARLEQRKARQYGVEAGWAFETRPSACRRLRLLGPRRRPAIKPKTHERQDVADPAYVGDAHWEQHQRRQGGEHLVGDIRDLDRGRVDPCLQAEARDANAEGQDA